tara:strand:+ start:204 stop:824 length:621 start_codon:yes stop_codon:yes gene_type:complete
MSGFGRTSSVLASDLASAPFDPAYLLFSGGVWIYAPPPAGGILNNYSAIANPGVNDDSGAGYSVGSEWINTITGAVFKNVDASAGAAVWEQINLTGAANEEAVTVDFAYNDISPVVVATLNAGDKVIISEIKTTLAFNDAAAFVRLGTPASPDLLMGASDSKVTRTGTYSSQQNQDILAGTNLQLIISPGAATVGTGQVIVTIRRA